MSAKVGVIVVCIVLASRFPVAAQIGSAGGGGQTMASAFMDTVAGVTVDTAVAQAIRNEPSLRAARSGVDAARGRRLQAGLRPNPSMSFARQIEPAGTDHETRIEMQWPLDLFRKSGRTQVADREVETTEYSVADRERLLAAEVRLKYGEVLTAVRELSISDDLIDTTRRQHELVAARVTEGSVPALDRDVLRVELQRFESERLLQAGHAEHALVELKRLLGLAPDASLKLRENLEQLTLRELAPPLASEGPSQDDRPDVKEADARMRLAEARTDQARSDGRLDASVFGMYMRTDTGFPQRALGPSNDLERVRGVFHYLTAGVMLTVPLRDRTQGAVAAAEAQQAGAAAELEAARLTAQAERVAARTRDEHARRAVAAYSAETLALARQNLDVIDQTYSLGRMTIFDVLAERRRYLEVERAYTNALREAYEARQALRRALGAVK